jgi:hypothetical protein
MKNNNPTRSGLLDLRRTRPDSDCDVVLSIGTGYEQKLMSPVAANVRNLLQDGALARFYRASMQSLSLNGQISWEDHWHGLDAETKKNQFRLTLPMRGKEPDIDDVDKMQYMCDQVRYHLGDVEGISRAFKAVAFFFELDGPLLLEGGRYRCHGSILSRSPDSRALVQNLASSYPYAQFFIQDTSTGFLSMNDLCSVCGRFQRSIAFYIRHPSDRVDLYLSFNRLFRRSISAFPQAMNWFVERQRLKVKFGHRVNGAEHSKPGSCSCEVQRERARILSSLASNSKKRPLSARTRSHNKRRCNTSL